MGVDKKDKKDKKDKDKKSKKEADDGTGPVEQVSWLNAPEVKIEGKGQSAS